MGSGADTKAYRWKVVMAVSSFKDLHDNYDKYKDLSEEELVGLIGEWWAHMFLESKEEIEKTLWRRAQEEKSNSQ